MLLYSFSTLQRGPCMDRPCWTSTAPPWLLTDSGVGFGEGRAALRDVSMSLSFSGWASRREERTVNSKARAQLGPQGPQRTSPTSPRISPHSRSGTWISTQRQLTTWERGKAAVRLL
ncbi:hypothetical protein BT67DRAFT_453695 [Trichocladium antarcticum]|uniref:Uncharacterized protein n=1 Tax=Trichocladium antarcticum TaxID=1450529 RepID=A0AAN6UQJ3_9PEZI|nr:hypothetical protein BT67DRAFT_453695 [Trichocladium antarcticum]